MQIRQREKKNRRKEKKMAKNESHSRTKGQKNECLLILSVEHFFYIVNIIIKYFVNFKHRLRSVSVNSVAVINIKQERAKKSSLLYERYLKYQFILFLVLEMINCHGS